MWHIFLGIVDCSYGMNVRATVRQDGGTILTPSDVTADVSRSLLCDGCYCELHVGVAEDAMHSSVS
jgi:hypothetical protein